MSRDRIPYFDFYPSDFMHGVRGLSAQEVGVYMMMLCRIYEENGPVEFHVMRLSTYCGMRESTFVKTVEKLIKLGKLQLVEGKITNHRAEAEISSRANKLKNNSKAGKASAEKRQQKQRLASTDVQQPFNHTDTDTDITSSLRSDVKAQAPEKPSVKSELMKVVDEDHAQAVIEHRKAIKKPMTVRAAQLLAGKFAKCQNPNAAVDMMISSGWQGFEPEWLENRKSSTRREPPPKRGETATDIWADELRERGILRDEPDSYASDLLDVGDGGRYFEGNVRPLRVAFSGSK
ncbi:uncharacterized protein YdaU (DUF1376 family) [Ochrobactrum intermedium]|uniref:DUF1376 domain-containing protein n=1 Tax=Brucella intermedia TaxID=94625 RepID=UPI0015CD91D0|nr:DUF1376 domain-containing protein [Brucella intermedia]NYD82086.1 uncharacterized protein YdaU (DUF1376 family) [Brucella intermedia]